MGSFLKKLFNVLSGGPVSKQMSSGPAQKQIAEEYRVALHEAGHAWGAVFAGWSVNSIMLIPLPEGFFIGKTNYNYGDHEQLKIDSEVYFNNPDSFVLLDGSRKQEVLDFAKRRLLVVLAGPFVEWKELNGDTLSAVIGEQGPDYDRIELIEDFLDEVIQDRHGYSNEVLKMLEDQYNLQGSVDKIKSIAEKVLSAESYKLIPTSDDLDMYPSVR